MDLNFEKKSKWGGPSTFLYFYIHDALKVFILNSKYVLLKSRLFPILTVAGARSGLVERAPLHWLRG